MAFESDLGQSGRMASVDVDRATPGAKSKRMPISRENGRSMRISEKVWVLGTFPSIASWFAMTGGMRKDQGGVFSGRFRFGVATLAAQSIKKHAG